jgi:hypothetical protein
MVFQDWDDPNILKSNLHYFLSVIQPVNKEIESKTDATISCVISGITQRLDSVVWKKEGIDVKSLPGNNYVVSDGNYDSNSQTTTLTVKAAANTADSTFTCSITTDEWLVTNKETVAVLNVFGEYILHLKKRHEYVSKFSYNL